MIITHFAIRRPIITIVTMIAIVVFGLAALRRLDTDEFPDISAPIVSVAIPYPGASPDVVEREVVTRIEDKLSGISGVDKISSTSTDGFAQIIVTFVFSKPVDQGMQDVRDAISAIRGQLPVEILEPILQRFDPNDLPIISLALRSTTMTAPQLTTLADERIAGELRAIAGVAQVNVVGGDSAQLNVFGRPTDLAATGVSVDQIVAALRAQNLASPVGTVNGPMQERSIRLEGRLARPEDFLNLIVTQRSGSVIRLGQVADVEAGAAEPRSAALYDGVRAIGLDIVRSKGYSTTAVSDRVMARIQELQRTLPAGTRLEVVRDAGTRVRNSVRNVVETLFEGAILTVLVVFLFLNSWRSTVITGLALPVSVLTSFVPLLVLGFTLNTMSLLGLSLAIGILIDDAIVVRENIVRHVEMGKDHYTASERGTDEIGLAVAATTFSIVAVFVPVGFMPGLAGQWFRPFALTIACAVLVSLFVSFSLDPMLSAYWADPHPTGARRTGITGALDRFNDWFNRQADRYKGVIAWALDHRLAVVGLATVSLVLAIVLQATIGGFEFDPESDRSELNIAVELPPGSSLNYARLKAEEIAAIVRARKEVAFTYTTVGSASGSGAIMDASIYVRLVPKAERAVSQAALARQLRGELRRVAGAVAFTFAAGLGGVQKPLQLQLQGPDETELAALADSIAAIVRTVPGATDVGLSTRGEKPELNLRIRRDLAGTLGLSLADIAQALRPAFAGVDAGTWVDPAGLSRHVHVRLRPDARENAADLERLPIVLPAVSGLTRGPTVLPLGQIATVSPGVGPAQIDHLDRQRVVTIGANVEGESLGRVAQLVQRRVRAIALPAGYHLDAGGNVESQEEVFVNMFVALGIAVLLMYLILVVQFSSFLDPLAILVSLPLSLIGVVLALLVTGGTLNIMSVIGVILLMGIVAKNAILLIDFAKWSRAERGLDRRAALIEAGRTRLRPIMMTTLALIAGMLPVALGYGEGADFRAPLGRAVIGGTITSTVLTLLVIPTVYEILDEWREWVLAKLGRRTRVLVGEPAVEPGD